MSDGDENATTMRWHDDEFKFAGTYRGGVKDGKPHGKGVLMHGGAYRGKCKRLIGVWKDGSKEGPFTRWYVNGARWEGEYVNNKREGLWKYKYPGRIDPYTDHYFYSNGFRAGGRAKSGARSRTEMIGGSLW